MICKYIFLFQVAPIYSHSDDFEPTFNLNYTINYWLTKGMDRSKIIMGIPLYGQSFTLASRKDHGLNSKTYGGASAGKFTRARGFLSYFEVFWVFLPSDPIARTCDIETKD